MRERFGVDEIFGFRPLAPALRDAWRALAGSPFSPRVRWGPSSLRILKPWISLPTWLGHTRADRRVPIYNFFNRVAAPLDAGYSVEVTYCRDFRGGRWTYDGHLGTDFACPVGTPTVAAAPGRVVRVSSEIDYGGLKVCIDHGDALFVTHNHLVRALVRPGDRVARGEVVGLTGASGLELALLFPWVSPHLHFNVWLDGVAIDPFAVDGEVSLWRQENDPVPHRGATPLDDAHSAPSAWDRAGVEAAIEACRDPDARALLRALPSLPERAAAILLLRSYRAAMFAAFPPLYAARVSRRPRLDLPFPADRFVGAWLPRIR